MIKRLTALLLAVSMLFSLSACGKGEEAVDITGKRYASDRAMDVFAAVEAVRQLKDYTFELRVSQLDPESGQLLRTNYTASGAWYSSTGQAQAQIALEDGTVLTNLTLDGSALYADLGTAASVLAPRLRELGWEADSRALEEAQERLQGDVVCIPLAEDPLTAWKSGRLCGSREGLERLFQKVKNNNARRVKLEKHVGSLSLGLGDIQSTLLDVTGDLLGNQSLYQGEFAQVLSEDFGPVLEQMNLEAESLLGEKWESIRQTDEELSELQSDGAFNGWTAKLLACGDEKSGYSLDLTLNLSRATNYCLSVWPAQAEKLTVPEQTWELREDAQSAAVVWQSAKKLVNHEGGEEEEELAGIDAEEYSGDQFKEIFGLDDMSWADVSTTAVEGSDSLVTGVMTTMDGGSRTVPLLVEHQELQSNSSSGQLDDIYESSNGYVLEYTTANKKDFAQTAENNAKLYADEFRNERGWDIVSEPGSSTVSGKGDAAAAGLVYHDGDSGQDVTVITCCLDVENSRFMLYLDIFVYSKSVTDRELQAIGDLMHYLGVEMPVEIIQN